MYEIILFDLDGTLTNPKLGITKSVQYALAKLGIYEENLDDLVKFIGPPLMNSFMDYYRFDETKAKMAVDYYREYYSESGIYENEVYDQIPTLLEELKTNKKELIIATSKPTVFVERVLKHFEIFKFFTSVVGSNLDGTRVSKEEIIGWILSNLKHKTKEKVIMIGDRKHDIIGAKANEIDSVGVTYGYGSIAEIQNEGPTYIIHNIAGLRQLFDV